MTNSRAGDKWSSELSSTPVTADTSAAITDNLFMGNQITLPTTHAFYKITAVECLNGSTINGNVNLGACIADADPPIHPKIHIVAECPTTAMSGASSVQKVNVDYSYILPAGTKLTGIVNNTGTGTYQYDTVSSRNGSKSLSSTNRYDSTENTAWSSTTLHMVVKIYYKGFGSDI